MYIITQLKVNENILQSFKSESATCIKLLSLKRKSRLGNIENESFLKLIPSRFILTSTWHISILLMLATATCLSKN